MVHDTQYPLSRKSSTDLGFPSYHPDADEEMNSFFFFSPSALPFTAAEISRYIKQTSNDDERTVVVITVDCISVGRFIADG